MIEWLLVIIGVLIGVLAAIILLIVALILIVRIVRDVVRRHRRGTNWWELPEFQNYDLGESFLLDFREGQNIQLIVDAALGRAHPRSQPYQCWRKIRITFPNVTKVNWTEKKLGQDGNADEGEIYDLVLHKGTYRVAGEWGEVEIASDPLNVEEIARETTDAWGMVPD